jgi:hypothetical protein
MILYSSHMPYKNHLDKVNAQKRFSKTDKWKAYMKAYRKTPQYKEADRRRRLRKYKAVRLACLSYYSGGPPFCECCKEKRMEFLSIDHINGGGTKHRKEIRKKYLSIYHCLADYGYPSGYRVLCQNCNSALGHYGYCPHSAVAGIAS